MLLLPGTPCRAAETDDIRDFVGEESILENAPEAFRQSGIDPDSEGGYASFWNGVRRFFLDALSLGFADGIKLLAKICGILLTGAVMRAMTDTAKGGRVHLVFQFICLVTLTFVTQNALEPTLDLVQNTMDGACGFLMASLPVSSLILAMGGETNRAVLQGVSLQHVIGIVSVITTQFLAPVLRFLMALTLAGSIAGKSLTPLTAFLAKFLKRSCLFLFTLLGAVLALKNALAAAADSVAMRGIRFAAGSFIPVVGNLVGEASRTLAAGIGLIRSECGVLCVMILLYLLARPVVLLFTQKIVFSAAGAMGEILGDSSSAGFLRGMSAVWDLFLAVCAFQGCYFIFSIVLFLKGGNGV